MGIRTPDIQLAKLALYQLSYTPRVPGLVKPVLQALGANRSFSLTLRREWVKTISCAAALVDVFYKAHW